MKLLPEKTLQGIGYACLRVAVLTYVVFGILLYVRQDEYIFVPPNSRMENCPELSDAQIIAMEGTRAYLLQSGTSTRIAVMYHGNGGSACDEFFTTRWLASRGFNVLNVEYAGYAGDTAKPSVDLILEDVAHVVRWVDAGHYSEVLIVGRSVGSGFASAHAMLAPPERLLLISPYDSLSQVAQGHFPVYPAKLLMKTNLENVVGASTAKRVLVIHGTKDVIIPFERGKSLFDQLSQQDKKFIPATGYGHNDVLDDQAMWSEIDGFLE